MIPLPRLAACALSLALLCGPGCVRGGFGVDGGAAADGGGAVTDARQTEGDTRAQPLDRGDTKQDQKMVPFPDLGGAKDWGDTGITVTLLTPKDGLMSPLVGLAFTFKATSKTPLSGCTLVLNGKDAVSGTPAGTLVHGALPDGNHLWNVRCEDKMGRKGAAPTPRKLTSQGLPLTACKQGGWAKDTKYRLTKHISKVSGHCMVLNQDGVLLSGNGYGIFSARRKDILYARGANQRLTVLDNRTDKVSSGAGMFVDGYKTTMDTSKTTSQFPSVADVDADGDLDLISPTVKGAIWVHKNDGKGDLGKQLWAPGTSSGFEATRLLDWDQDGKLDMFAANLGGLEQCYWGVSGSSSPFKGSVSADLGDYTRFLDLGDFNGDKRLDVVGTNDLTPGASDTRRHIMLNQKATSHATFKAGWISDPDQDSGPWPTFVADFDGDGDHDLLTARIYSGTNRACRVRLNDGSGTKFPSKLMVPSCEPLGALDMDKDGHTDLVLALLDTTTGKRHTVQVQLGDGKGSFVAGQKIALSAQSDPLAAIGDLDNDGLPEVVLGPAGTAGALAVHGRTKGSAPFAARWKDKASFVYNAINLRDLDSDGLVDILISRTTNKTHHMAFMRNKGSAGFSTDWLSLATGGDAYSPVLSAGDLHSAPATGIRITGKGVKVSGIKEVRGFSTGVEVAAANAEITGVVVTDPDLYGVLVTGATAATLSNIVVRRHHLGVGLALFNSTGVVVNNSTFCPVARSSNLTALSSYCLSSKGLTGKGNKVLLNNGCKGMTTTVCP